ncbi:hypothetical protein Ddc_21935 [Ditylenchus destructor]|nr:hypothetical protein Ddc_21935 [Ditylenchus destructor]
MQHITNPVNNSESGQANANKASEKAKSPADEHPVAEDGAAKGKAALDRIDIVREDSVLATAEALQDHFEKIKAEVNAAQTRTKSLVESTCDLEKKLQNSETQKQQLANELHTLEGKNRETLERNRKLEQELSDSQAKIRDLEAKFAQTDVAQVIDLVKKMENGEISRLQTDVLKLSSKYFL